MRRGVTAWMGLLLVVAMVWAALEAQAEEGCRQVVPVTVLDKDGRTVTNLSADDFRAEYRGQKVRVVSAAYNASPGRVVILLDTSDSMMWAKYKWALAREAVQDVVAHAPSETAAALFLFSEKAKQVVRFSDERRAVADQLSLLGDDPKALRELAGGTALLDAIVSAMHAVETIQPGDTVYVITDGGDNRSRARESEVRQLLWRNGVRLFAFWLFDPDRSSRSPGREAVLGLAEETGGGWLSVSLDSALKWYETKPRPAGPLAPALYSRMLGFYRIEVELPGQTDKARKWSVEVVDAQGKRRKGLDVYYQRQLMPCGEEKP